MRLVTIRGTLQSVCMTMLGFTVATKLMVLLQQYPLQLSGNFIELAIVFVILALVAAALGASGVAGISMTIAKWFVIIFVVLAILTFVL